MSDEIPWTKVEVDLTFGLTCKVCEEAFLIPSHMVEDSITGSMTESCKKAAELLYKKYHWRWSEEHKGPICDTCRWEDDE